MINDQTKFKPAGDAVGLTRLALAARSSFTALALRMLPDLKPETHDLLVALCERGWCTAIELSTDPHGQQALCLTAVGPAGERRVLAGIAEGAPGAPN
jgi:hypothetical protein